MAGGAKFVEKKVISGVPGREEPAGTHETKLDQTTGEVLFAVGCRHGRPLGDSGSVVSTCPVDYATSVPIGEVNYSVKLERLLGESTAILRYQA